MDEKGDNKLKIIRDPECGVVTMLPLFMDWQIRRCNVKGCRDKPTTIISDLEKQLLFGLCEKHFQQGNTPSGYTYGLEFDDYDAFGWSKK